MKKIILDTNILISALIQRSFPYLIIYHDILEGKVELCISDDLFDEYFQVINRPKFAKYPDFLSKAELVLTQILEISKKYYPTEKINIIKDKNDNKLLELAVISDADFLITGNTNDFTMTEFGMTKIVTPRDYWENYR